MSRRISPMPTHFDGDRDRDYWHTSQDIAYRIGASLIERDHASWLISDAGERLLVPSEDSDRLWYKTYLVLSAEYPGATRVWHGGHAVTKPGETPGDSDVRLE